MNHLWHLWEIIWESSAQLVFILQREIKLLLTWHPADSSKCQLRPSVWRFATAISRNYWINLKKHRHKVWRYSISKIDFDLTLASLFHHSRNLLSLARNSGEKLFLRTWLHAKIRGPWRTANESCYLFYFLSTRKNTGQDRSHSVYAIDKYRLWRQIIMHQRTLKC